MRIDNQICIIRLYFSKALHKARPPLNDNLITKNIMGVVIITSNVFPTVGSVQIIIVSLNNIDYIDIVSRTISNMINSIQ